MQDRSDAPIAPAAPNAGGTGARLVSREVWSLGLASALVVAAFVAPRLAQGETFLDRDMVLVYAPLGAFLRERLAGFELPRWYPADGLGQPFIGMTVSGVFHPFTWLSLLGGATGLVLRVVAGLLAAFAGAVLLGRRWFADWGVAGFLGAGYALSGYPLSMSNNALYLAGLAALPWVLLFLDQALVGARKAPLAAAALAWASVALAGDVTGFGAVALAALALALVRGAAPLGVRLARVAGTGALALGLSAVQVVPGLFTSSLAGSAQNAGAGALVWSVHPARWLELALGPLSLVSGAPAPPLVREVFRTPAELEWAASLHLGLPFLALAAAFALRRPSRAVALVLGAWALAVWVWLGAHGGLASWLLEWLPLGRVLRTPEKLTPLVVLGLVAAAAVELRCRAQAPSPWSRAAPWAIASGLGFAAAALAGPLAALLPRGALDDASREALTASLRLGGLGWGVASGGVAAVAAWRPARLTWAAAAAVLLVAWGQGQSVLRMTPAAGALDEPAWAGAVRARVGEGAWGRFSSKVCAGESLPAGPVGLGCAGTSALWGGLSSDFYLPAFSARVHDFDDQVNLFYRLAGTRYLLAHAAEVTNHERYAARWGDERGLGLFEDRAARPRAWLAQAVPAATHDEAKALMHRPELANAPELVVVEGASGAPQQAWRRGRIAGELDAPERQRFVVAAPDASWLVVNDAWYDGWSATVDDLPEAVRPADLLLRAVQVPPGRHVVELRFSQPGLTLGAALSALAAVALVLVWRGRLDGALAR